MSKLGGISADQRNKAIAIAAFVLIAVGIVYYEYFAGGTPNPAAAPGATTATTTANESAPASAAAPATASGKDAKVVRTSAASLDPTLRMDAMLVSESVEYAGSGRNIFSPNSAPPPVVIPPPVKGPRINTPPPAPPAPVGPPPKPPIDLKFFGFETGANGQRQAFLLHGDNVYLASAGEVVLRRYRVITIDAKTIQVEDMQDNSTQTLPLLAN